MRLTVSQYLARLPDRAINTVWGDAPLGDTSLTAGASFSASWYFEPRSVDPGRWRADRPERRSLGRVRRRSPEQWADGRSQRQWVVKKAESAGGVRERSLEQWAESAARR